MGISKAYNMDCMEAMREMPDKCFDLAVCDPPYGIKINMNAGRRKNAKNPKREEKDWDNHTPNEEYFQELFRVSKNQIIWGGNYFHLPLTRSWIVWNKHIPEETSFSSAELCWTSFDRKMLIADIPYNGAIGRKGEITIHPTQKPVSIYEWILRRYAKLGDKILDTHLGSGSSRIAAYDAGMDFVGFEIDREYFDKQEERFAYHISQQSIFVKEDEYEQTVI